MKKNTSVLSDVVKDSSPLGFHEEYVKYLKGIRDILDQGIDLAEEKTCKYIQKQYLESDSSYEKLICCAATNCFPWGRAIVDEEKKKHGEIWEIKNSLLMDTPDFLPQKESNIPHWFWRDCQIAGIRSK